MIYGTLVGENVVMLTDQDHGKPVVETTKPVSVPPGYIAKGVWVETADQLMLVYDILPAEGTAEEAALALSKLQFKSLPDEAAYQFRALADTYIVGTTYYGPSDPSGMPQSRVIYESDLYKCLQTHTAQADWTPTNAPSLWAKILPGQEGSGVSLGEWTQPESTNGYKKGDKVIYNGHVWESIVDNNVWVPGSENGTCWTDLGEYSK